MRVTPIEERPKIRLDSAFLVERPDGQWELRDMQVVAHCFSYELTPDPTGLLASGSMAACYEEAKRLGFHVDIIRPLK